MPIFARSALEEIIGISSFTSIVEKEYSENINFSKERYLNLLTTYSWVQLLPEDVKINLFEDLEQLWD